MGVYVAWGYIDHPIGTIQHTWTVYGAAPIFAAQASLSAYASGQQPYHMADAYIDHYTLPNGESSSFIGTPVAAIPNARSVTFALSVDSCYASASFTMFT